MSRKESKSHKKSKPSSKKSDTKVKKLQGARNADVDAVQPILASTPNAASTSSLDTPPNGTKTPTTQRVPTWSDALAGSSTKFQQNTSSEEDLSQTKNASFVDVSGQQVAETVIRKTKRSASKELRAFKVFTIDDSVRIFFISTDGSVETQEDTWALYIVRLSSLTGKAASDEGKPSPITRPAALLHVGAWLYPLYPGCSPILITAFGTYLFPDLRNNRQGSSVALVLPHNLSLDDREKFEVLLDYYGLVEDSVNRLGSQHLSVSTSKGSTVPEWVFKEEEKTPSEKLSAPAASIKYLFQTIVWFIMLVIQLFEWIIRYLARLIRASGRRASKHHPVDENILKGVLYAKSATNKGVIMTSYVVDNLHQEAANLTRLLTPDASAFVPVALRQSPLGSAFKVTAEVSATTFRGMSDVYTCLTDASSQLMDAFFEETIKTMEYKYGEEYGNLTKEACDAAMNVREAWDHTHRIQTLAFVPISINTQLREGLLRSDSEEEDSEELQLLKERASGGKDVENETTFPRFSDFQEQGSTQGSIFSRRENLKANRESFSTGGQVLEKIGWASLNLESQAILQAKIRDSDTNIGTEDSSRRMTQELRKSIVAFKEQAKQETALRESLENQNVDHFNPLTTRSSGSDDPRDFKPSFAAHLSRTSHGLARTASISRTSSRATIRSSIVSTTSRESLFLSHRRQSMHIIAAMAKITDAQFSDLHNNCPGLALCSRGPHDNLFREAAVSIVRAKIRRSHRETAAERFLVVVRLATKLNPPPSDS